MTWVRFFPRTPVWRRVVRTLRRSPRTILTLAVPFLLLIVVTLVVCVHPATTGEPLTPGDAQEGTVTHLIDGDTFDMTIGDGTTLRVRLLGIDAPEIAHQGTQGTCGGDLAATTLAQTLPAGTTVTIHHDPISDPTDRYGRTLAYVSTPDIPDIGLTQITHGYAEAWYPHGEPAPTRYIDYQTAEQAARTDLRGAWASCPTLGRP